MYFSNSAIRNTGKSFHYTAPGYRYVLHNTGSMGTRANLQVKKELLNRFVERVGHINTIGQPHLVVTQSGGGWWLVTVLDEMYASLVTKFLARFNKWMAKRMAAARSVQAELPPVVVSNSLHSRYTLTAPEQTATPPRINVDRRAPSLGALALLASKFHKPHNNGARQ